MHRIGTILIWIGVILNVVGLGFGFGTMLINADSQAVSLLGLVPIGFVALLAGVVTVLFSRPQSSPERDNRRELK